MFSLRNLSVWVVCTNHRCCSFCRVFWEEIIAEIPWTQLFARWIPLWSSSSGGNWGPRIATWETLNKKPSPTLAQQRFIIGSSLGLLVSSWLRQVPLRLVLTGKPYAGETLGSECGWLISKALPNNLSSPILQSKSDPLRDVPGICSPKSDLWEARRRWPGGWRRLTTWRRGCSESRIGWHQVTPFLQIPSADMAIDLLYVIPYLGG